MKKTKAVRNATKATHTASVAVITDQADRATIRRSKAARVKTWNLVTLIVDALLEDYNTVTFNEVANAARELGIGPLRNDLIPCSLMGRDYYIDCRNRVITKG